MRRTDPLGEDLLFWSDVHGQQNLVALPILNAEAFTSRSAFRTNIAAGKLRGASTPTGVLVQLTDPVRWNASQDFSGKDLDGLLRMHGLHPRSYPMNDGAYVVELLSDSHRVACVTRYRYLHIMTQQGDTFVSKILKDNELTEHNAWLTIKELLSGESGRNEAPMAVRG